MLVNDGERKLSLLNFGEMSEYSIHTLDIPVGGH